MTCPCTFILDNKCTTLVSDVDNWGDYVCVGEGVHGKFLYLALNFVVDLKLFFKKSLKINDR